MPGSGVFSHQCCQQPPIRRRACKSIFGETLGLLELEALRLLRVHASHARDRGDDVGAFGVRRAGAGGHVEVAGGIDDDAAANGLRAFLGLDDHAGRAAVLDDR